MTVPRRYAEVHLVGPISRSVTEGRALESPEGAEVLHLILHPATVVAVILVSSFWSQWSC
jgi:hypothetical protein